MASIYTSNFHTNELVTISGGIYQTIYNLMQFHRTLWDFLYLHEDQKLLFKKVHKKDLKQHNYRYLILEEFTTIINKRLENDEFIRLLIGDLSENHLLWNNNGQNCYRLELLFFEDFIRKVFIELLSNDDITYYIRKSIRNYYNLHLSFEIESIFHFISSFLNTLISIEKKANDKRRENDYYCVDKQIIVECIEKLGNQINLLINKKGYLIVESEISNIIQCYFEVCQLVGFIRPAYQLDCFRIRPDFIDAEFLLSNIFGFPTNIPGFDSLFGGGGIMLLERNSINANSAFKIPTNSLNTRATTIIGECGSGKTILALQIAFECARKGGKSIYIPLDQTISECLYIIGSIQSFSLVKNVEIITNAGAIYDAIFDLNPNKGYLFILNNEEDPTESLEDFLLKISEFVNDFPIFGLKIIIIDPINSINPYYKQDEEGLNDTSNLRKITTTILNKIKSVNTNILFITEELNNQSILSFFENISDTLIRLSVKKRHNYAKRFIEIVKSRFQREQRGEHAFSIKSGAGINIYPSTAAVQAIIKSRSQITPINKIKFGMDKVDYIIHGSLFEGDVISFVGPSGSFKSLLGYYFIKTEKIPPPNFQKVVSILFDVRATKVSVTHLFDNELVKGHAKYFTNREKDYRLLKSEDVKIYSLPHGYSDPGLILQLIEREIVRQRLIGHLVQRVMIDNVSQWEVSSPFIKEEPLFSSTLIKLLRGLGVTCLFICDDNQNIPDNSLQKAIIDNSDCVFHFEKFDFRGLRRVVMRVVKTRDMNHRLELFEIRHDDESLNIIPSTVLLRFQSTEGNLVPMPINMRLFFHIESEIQKKYYNSIKSTFSAILSKSTEIDIQDRIYLNRRLPLGQFSAMDELQIIQIDEFQLSMYMDNNDENSNPLYKFSGTQLNNDSWNELFYQLIEDPNFKFVSNSNELIHFYSLPFIQNVSFLAYKKDLYKGNIDLNWEELAVLCQEWENKNKFSIANNNSNPKLFFDFPKVSNENYNCLFLEILFSNINLKDLDFNECPIRSIISNQYSIKAGLLFRQLCRRAYLSDIINKNSYPLVGDELTIPYNVSTNAVVWRHWFTTFSQMLLGLKDEEINKIEISPLPNNISVAGEWYLGVPGYSAAPDVGLEIIKLLTSKEAELNRFIMGVGLPTRSSFYSDVKKNSKTPISSSYDIIKKIDIPKLIDSSFRRSNLKCYYQISEILAFFLKRILEIAQPKGHSSNNLSIENQIKLLFSEFENKINFIQGFSNDSKKNFLCNPRCKICINKIKSRVTKMH